MTTKELIEALQKADPTGERPVCIYVDSSDSVCFHPDTPLLHEPKGYEEPFAPYVFMSTGPSWEE
jgi:hypothetical protein